jgi:hypothetical protein
MPPFLLCSVTYDWHTDAGEAGIVTARVAKQRPRSAGPARNRPEWMGAHPEKISLSEFTGAALLLLISCAVPFQVSKRVGRRQPVRLRMARVAYGHPRHLGYSAPDRRCPFPRIAATHSEILQSTPLSCTVRQQRWLSHHRLLAQALFVPASRRRRISRGATGAVIFL